MEKIEIQLKQPKNKTIEYNGYEIQVSPIITAGEQMGLIASYITSLLSEKVYGDDKNVDAHGYFNRELGQMMYIINSHTNISLNPEDAGTFFDSEVWESIKQSIINYEEFRDRQDLILGETLEKIERETSISNLVSSLFEKYAPIVEKLLEINPEELKKLQEDNEKLFKELREFPLIKDMERQD